MKLGVVRAGRAISRRAPWTSRPSFWRPPAPTARHSWRSRISSSSSATTCPTSTPCSSATSATASPAAAISRTPWGDVRQLSAKGIEEIQAGLQAQGYAVAKIDGKAGMNTRALIGAYQKANSLKVDCWPSEAVLDPRARQAPAGTPPSKAPAPAEPGGARCEALGCRRQEL